MGRSLPRGERRSGICTDHGTYHHTAKHSKLRKYGVVESISRRRQKPRSPPVDARGGCRVFREARFPPRAAPFEGPRRFSRGPTAGHLQAPPSKRAGPWSARTQQQQRGGDAGCRHVDAWRRRCLPAESPPAQERGARDRAPGGAGSISCASQHPACICCCACCCRHCHRAHRRRSDFGRAGRRCRALCRRSDGRGASSRANHLFQPGRRRRRRRGRPLL